MTPPRHESDAIPLGVLRDNTEPLDPSEISSVQEAERFALDVHKRSAALFARMQTAMEAFESKAAKAEETSSAMIKLPKQVRLWQAIAACILALGGGGAYAGTATLVERVEARQGVSEQAAAQAAAEANAAAAYLVAPRQEPADVGRIAATLDRLDSRLEGIEARLERLEQRRGR